MFRRVSNWRPHPKPGEVGQSAAVKFASPDGRIPSHGHGCIATMVHPKRKVDYRGRARAIPHPGVGRPLLCVALITLVSSCVPVVSAGKLAGAAAPTPASGGYVDGSLTNYQQLNFNTVSFNGLRGGYPTFTMSDPAGSFQAWFAAPAGQALVPGDYEGAQRFDFRSPGTPGVDVFGNGAGCNTISGSSTSTTSHSTVKDTFLHLPLNSPSTAMAIHRTQLSELSRTTRIRPLSTATTWTVPMVVSMASVMLAI